MYSSTWQILQLNFQDTLKQAAVPHRSLITPMGLYVACNLCVMVSLASSQDLLEVHADAAGGVATRHSMCSRGNSG